MTASIQSDLRLPDGSRSIGLNCRRTYTVRTRSLLQYAEFTRAAHSGDVSLAGALLKTPGLPDHRMGCRANKGVRHIPLYNSKKKFSRITSYLSPTAGMHSSRLRTWRRGNSHRKSADKNTEEMPGYWGQDTLFDGEDLRGVRADGREIIIRQWPGLPAIVSPCTQRRDYMLTGPDQMYTSTGMKHEPVMQLHRNFEDYVQVLDGAGFRLARDLQELFGCTERRNFSRAVPEPRNSSIKPGHAVSYDIVTINTMVARGFGSEHRMGGA